MKADDIIRELREALDAIPEDEREWSLRMRPMRVLADVRDGLGEYVADMAMAEDARYIAAASPARMAVLLDYIDDQRREAVAEALREAGVCPTCRGRGCWSCAGTGRARHDWRACPPPRHLLPRDYLALCVDRYGARWVCQASWADADLGWGGVPEGCVVTHWMPVPVMPRDRTDAATTPEPSLWQTGSPPEPGIYITSYADTPPDEDWTGIDYWDGDEWEETMDDRTPDFWMPLPPTPRSTS